MRLLLDTHILLWALSGDSRLPQDIREMLEAGENRVYYSVASLWEVELKHIAHPDKLSFDARMLEAYCMEAEFAELPIERRHISGLCTLQRRLGAKPHKDPFDQLLICQAKTDCMLLISHDSMFADYQEDCIKIV